MPPRYLFTFRPFDCINGSNSPARTQPDVTVIVSPHSADECSERRGREQSAVAAQLGQMLAAHYERNPWRDRITRSRARPPHCTRHAVCDDDDVCANCISVDLHCAHDARSERAKTSCVCASAGQGERSY